MSNKQCCIENWDIMPYASKHVWASGLHGEPTGNCLHCGKPYDEYSRQMIDKMIEQHDEDLREFQAEEAARLEEEARDEEALAEADFKLAKKQE